jgi:hypothetical protein
MQAIRLKRIIKKSGELHLNNLLVEEGQQVELLLLFTPKTKTKSKKQLTARQLLNSGLIGMWKNRTDITDSLEYAHQLREQAERRHR